LIRQRFAFRFFCLALLAECVGQAQQPVQSGLVAIRALDARVATIGHRLAVASLDWCRDRQWLPGIALHDLSQYGAAERPAAIRAFGLDGGPAILALAAAGPAERDGLAVDDVVVELEGAPPPRAEPGPTGSFAGMERILAALDAAFADGTARIGVRRRGAAREVTMRAARGCATHFQLAPGRSLNAYADGRYVQLTSAIVDYVADDSELAAVLAHEFAHNVLRHRARLDAAGVARGFFGNFGRNARLIRETEEEADRLSVWLLDRAGFDPAAAIRFWSRFGRRGLNIIGSPTHGGWRGRVARFETEIAAIRAARAAGASVRPAFLPPVDPD